MWATTSDPRTEFVTVRLTKSEAEEVDRVAQESGRTRSAVVRAAVEEYVGKKKRAPKRAAKKKESRG